MATQGSYSIQIKAVDLASDVVAKINANLAAQRKQFDGINKSVASFGKEMSRFGKITGLTGISQGIKQVGMNVATLGKNIGKAMLATTKFLAGLVGISSFASVAGVVALIHQFSSYSQALVNNSKQIGISAKELQAFQLIGEAAGISVQSMTNGLLGLSKTLEDIKYGRDPAAAALYAAHGITGTDAKTAMPQIADMVKNWTGPQAALNELLSQMHIPADMLPVLRLGAAGMEKLRKETAKYNDVTQAGLDIAEKFRFAQAITGEAADSLGRSISTALTPALTALYDGLRPLIDQLSGWFKANREWITAETVELVHEFIGWLQSFKASDFSDAWNSIKGIYLSISNTVTAMGGWKTVAVALGVVFALTLLAPVAQILLLVGRISTGLAALAAPAAAAMAPFAAVLAALGLGTVAAFKTGEQVADAASLGFRSNGNDEFGNVTEYINPTTGEKVSALDMPNYIKTHSGGGGGTSGPPTTDAEKSDRAKLTYDTLKGKGWSDENIAGVLANMQHEGNFNPRIHEGTGTNHVGGMQWDATRQANFLSLYGHAMDDPKSDTNQLVREQAMFIDWELRNSHKAVGAALRGAGAGASGTIINDQYEVSGQSRGDAGLAEQWMGRIKGWQPVAKAPVAPIQKQSSLDANVNVAFAGFPMGLFKTSASSDNGFNTRISRTSGPVFA
jgi:Phage tail lysozyme